MSVYKNDNPQYLDEALKSIYDEQTLKPDEVVIVMDGPLTEELYHVINNFLKKHQKIVNVIKLDENLGLGNALRIGTDYCNCNYIMRMDADDISVPDRFEKQINYLKKHPEVDCLGGFIEEFNHTIDENKRKREVPLKQEQIINMSKSRNPMNHVTVCIKKSSLELCGGYEEINLLEDYYLWLKMIINGCILENIEDTLVYVRVGNGFNSKRGAKKRIEGWKKLQNYMLLNNLINKRKSFMNMVYINVFVYMPNSLRRIVYDIFLRK